MVSLTAEDRAYALRWMEARGKEPEDHGYGVSWSDLEAEPEGLPAMVLSAMQCVSDWIYDDRIDAIDALAIALREMRRVLEGVE